MNKSTLPPSPDGEALEVRGSSAVASRLRKVIHSGEYAKGDRLPPERDLAAAFEVARSTIRKALEMLDAEGVVERRIGSGTFVTYEGPLSGLSGDITEEISLTQLLEARIALEPQVARLAALHAGEQDIAALQTALANFNDELSPAEFLKLDTELHLAIAVCSRNPLFVRLYEQIRDIRLKSSPLVMENAVVTPEQLATYGASTRKL